MMRRRLFAGKFCIMVKGGALLFLALTLLILPIQWLGAMFIAALVHELGHIVAVKAFGGKIHGFSCGWEGALILARIDSRWKEIAAILAGPCAGAVLILFVRWIPRVAILAAIQTLFNLLPIYPLDGGRLIRCLGAGKRMTMCIEYAVLICVLLVGIYLCFYIEWGFLPLIVVFAVVYRVFMEKLLAKRRDFEYNRWKPEK